MSGSLYMGYEVEALHYLVKPVDAAKISSCMERVYGRYMEQEKREVILTEAREMVDGEKNRRITLRLLPEDIVYIEAAAHNTELHTREKCYVVREAVHILNFFIMLFRQIRLIRPDPPVHQPHKKGAAQQREQDHSHN